MAALEDVLRLFKGFWRDFGLYVAQASKYQGGAGQSNPKMLEIRLEMSQVGR